MHMHSGGHARKRIDFYILLCGIWCFPHRTRSCFSFFPERERERERKRERGRFFLFYFPFFPVFQTQVEFFVADCIQKGHGQDVGRLGRASASAAAAAATPTAPPPTGRYAVETHPAIS